MRTRTMGSADARRSPLADERGMLLVITMIILLVVSTLAAANLINAFLERSIARNQTYASIALNAADAGLGAGLAWLNDPNNAASLPGSTGNRPANPGDPWLQAYLDPPLSTDLTITRGQPLFAYEGKAVTYDYTLSLLTDANDRDQDGDTTEIVVFNHAKPALPAPNAGNHGKFDYAGSYFFNAGEGYPVVKVDSRGRYGLGGYRNVVLEVARNKFNIRANGAVTAMGNVNVTGNITVDGRSHDSNGNLGGTCADSYVGVNVPAPLDLNGDGDYTDAGESGYAVDEGGSSSPLGNPTGTGESSIVSYSPDQALGLCDSNGDGDCDDGGETKNVGGPIDEIMAGLPSAGSIKVNGNITYANITGNYDISTSGTGVLIVHNPLFDARVWHCSAAVVPNPAHPSNANQQVANPALTAPPAGQSNECWQWNAGTATHDRPYYDAALNADYQTTNFAHEQTGAYAGPRRPRNLTGNSNVTYKGAIIADQINPINGNIRVIGAIISLSGVSITVLGTGSAEVLYSCDALNLFTAQGYSTKLGWHRLY